MHRTSLLLPEDLLRRASAVARRRGTTVSQMIRSLLAQAVAAGETDRAQDPFWTEALTFRSGSKRLAEGHDDELYTTLAQHLLFPRRCCARVVRGVRGA